jgi:hypothetical protein
MTISIKSPAFYLLTAILFASISVTAQIDKQYREKAAKLIQWITAAKPLPPGLKAINNPRSLSHRKIISYKTMRTQNAFQPDSVVMTVMTDDSLEDLEFNEEWWSKGKNVKGYHYNIEKGDITWAYNFGLSVKTVYEISLKNSSNGESVSIEKEPSYIIDKKDTTWTYTKEDQTANEERNRQAFPIYEKMLKFSIDELYNMVFK